MVVDTSFRPPGPERCVSFSKAVGPLESHLALDLVGTSSFIFFLTSLEGGAEGATFCGLGCSRGVSDVLDFFR